MSEVTLDRETIENSRLPSTRQPDSIKNDPFMQAQDFNTSTGFDDTKPYKKNPRQAYSTVVGGAIYMLFPGCIYITGVLQTYI